MRISHSTIEMNSQRSESVDQQRDRQVDIRKGTLAEAQSLLDENTLEYQSAQHRQDISWKQDLSSSSASTVMKSDGSSTAQITAQVSSQLVEQSLDLSAEMKRVNLDPGENFDDISDPNRTFDLATIDLQSYRHEKEHTSVVSEGHIKLDNGDSIQFRMELDLEREFEGFESKNLELVDPLMINIEGGAVELSDARFDFDLKGNGEQLSINQTAKGTGFIAFDKNNNGQLDNGYELFGVHSGYSYADLAQYDEDGNGWIDEGDSVFQQLKFVDFDEEGNTQMQSLSDVKVGALYTGSVSSDFRLTDDQNNLLGMYRRSSIALTEDYQTLNTAQVDMNFERFSQIQLSSGGEVQNMTVVSTPFTMFRPTSSEQTASSNGATETVAEDTSNTFVAETQFGEGESSSGLTGTINVDLNDVTAQTPPTSAPTGAASVTEVTIQRSSSEQLLVNYETATQASFSSTSTSTEASEVTWEKLFGRYERSNTTYVNVTTSYDPNPASTIPEMAQYKKPEALMEAVEENINTGGFDGFARLFFESGLSFESEKRDSKLEERIQSMRNNFSELNSNLKKLEAYQS